jgi:hypothetical protein
MKVFVPVVLIDIEQSQHNKNQRCDKVGKILDAIGEGHSYQSDCHTYADSTQGMRQSRNKRHESRLTDAPVLLPANGKYRQPVIRNQRVQET